MKGIWPTRPLSTPYPPPRGLDGPSRVPCRSLRPERIGPRPIAAGREADQPDQQPPESACEHAPHIGVALRLAAQPVLQLGQVARRQELDPQLRLVVEAIAGRVRRRDGRAVPAPQRGRRVLDRVEPLLGLRIPRACEAVLPRDRLVVQDQRPRGLVRQLVGQPPVTPQLDRVVETQGQPGPERAEQ